MSDFERLPTLTQLRHLIAVADNLHFGRAAEACYITQPSLSASIKELELMLGKTLVERTRRQVQLTPLGGEIVEQARGVVQATKSLYEHAASERPPLTGTLRLGVIPTIAPYLLPRVLPKIRNRYPSLKLYLREAQSADIVAQVRGGALDLVLLAFPYPVDGLETRIVGEDAFQVAIPHNHSFHQQNSVSAESLQDQKLLLLEEGHCLRDQALSVCRLTPEPGGSTPVEFQATSLQTLVQMVANGLGVTFLPQMAIKAGIADTARILVKPLEGDEKVRQIGFAWRASSPRKAEFQLLMDFFAS